MTEAVSGELVFATPAITGELVETGGTTSTTDVMSWSSSPNCPLSIDPAQFPSRRDQRKLMRLLVRMERAWELHIKRRDITERLQVTEAAKNKRAVETTRRRKMLLDNFDRLAVMLAICVIAGIALVVTAVLAYVLISQTPFPSPIILTGMGAFVCAVIVTVVRLLFVLKGTRRRRR